jgi:hypothetical protein
LHVIDFLLLTVQRQRDGTWVSMILCVFVFI